MNDSKLILPILMHLLTLLLIMGGFQSHARESAGKTIVALGTVNAENPEESRMLKRRSPVFGVDTVKTQENSRTQLRMVDGGLLSLKQLSQLDIASYEFDKATQQGSVAMSLVKGGLRTVTGILTDKTENYRLNTPVASIGVRGTHYSAQMEEGDLLLAVWDGAIVVQVTVGEAPTKFELGPQLKFSNARIKANGEVEFLMQTPKSLVLGHTPQIQAGVKDTDIDLSGKHALFSEEPIESYTSPFELASNQYDQLGDEWVDNDSVFGAITPPSDGISRTGTASFGLLQHSFTSSVGPLSAISMNMTVDFSLSRIPTGNLSFTDAGGEWFAVFNGVIRDVGLDININFASHGNNLADGSISGLFVDNASQIYGDLSLAEINNPGVNAGGSFVLGEIIP